MAQSKDGFVSDRQFACCGAMMKVGGSVVRDDAGGEGAADESAVSQPHVSGSGDKVDVL